MQRKLFVSNHLAVTAVIALLANLAAPLRAQVGLGLSPMRMELSLQPAVANTGSLQLANETSEVTHVKGEVLDFYIDDEENPQFGNYPESSDSCRSFMRISPRDADLGPKQQLLVRYTLNPAASVRPGTYHCAIGYTTEPVPNRLQSGLAINVRVITAFYLNVGNPNYQSQVSRISLEPNPVDPKTKLRAFCILTNVGDYVWRPVGGLDVVAIDGTVREHVPLRSLPVFPKRSQRFLLPLKKNPAEGETLRLSMNIGNGEIEQARAVVSNKMLDH